MYTVTAVFKAVDNVTKTVAGIERSLNRLGATTKNVQRITKGAQKVWDGFGDALRGVGSVAKGLVSGVKQIGSAVWRAIPGTEFLGRTFRRAGAALRYGVLPSLGQATARLATNAAQWVANLAPVRAVTNAVTAFGAKVKAVVGPPLTKAAVSLVRFGRSAARIAAPIVKGVGKIAGGFARVVGGAAGMARGVLGAVGQVGAAIGSKMVGAVQSAIPHFQSVGRAAMTGLGLVATAATGAAVALGSLVVAAAPLQNVSAAFDGIAQSAGKSGTEMLSALEQGSAGMIAQRDLMMSFNNAAMLVSEDFAVQLPDAMQYLGKVSAATGKDMGYLMDSLVTGVGRLSPIILDNLNVQVSLAEASARAAQMFGVEENALTKAQQQAGMTAVVLEKLEANTAALPDVAGSAAAQIAEFGAELQNTKDMAGSAFLPVLSALMPLLLGLLGHVQSLIPAFERIGGAIGKVINLIASGTDPITAVQAALLKFAPPELISSLMGITLQLQAFLGWVRQIWAAIQPFVETVSGWIIQNITLGDVLGALGIAISTVVLPALWGMIAAAAPIILAIGALIGIVALLRTAWEQNWGGIQEKAAAVGAWLQANVPLAFAAIANFWQTVLQPALQQLANWLATNLPLAGQALANFWNGTLLPALQGVWAWMQGSLFPFLESLADFLGATLGVAVSALAGLWQNVLQPALSKVADFISGTLGPVLEEFKSWLGDVTGGVDGVANAVKTATDWLSKMADKIRNVNLPDWLTPGSPTPFEMGLRGISNALQEITQVRLPQFGTELSRLETMRAMASVPTNQMVQHNDNRQYNTITLDGQAGDESLADKLSWRLRRARVYGGG